MSVVWVASAHGSPGATTLAVALAGLWPSDHRFLLVEVDPWGGMLAARLGLRDDPGLMSLLSAGRRGLNREIVWAHTQELTAGIPVLVGPSAADSARRVTERLMQGLVDWAEDESVDLVMDCGRAAVPAAGSVVTPDHMLVVVRPTVDQLRPAVSMVAALIAAGVRAELVLVGDRPYHPEEVEFTFGVPVAGVVADDPQAAAALSGGAWHGGVGSSRLVRSAASLLDHLLIEVVT